MVADTYDAVIGMLEMGTGNQNNSWGTSFNASVTNIIGRAVAGVNNRAVTGGTLDLSTSPPPAGPRGDLDFIQIINGALVSAQTIVVPAISRSNWWYNNTTGGFPLLLKITGTGTLIEIPVNTGKFVINTGSFLLRNDISQIGRIFTHGGAAPPAGAFACNGASLLRADHPDLFAAIGTTWGAVDGTHFTLPNLQDTGRFLRSSSGSLTVGTYQSNQNLSHIHTITGAPGVGTLSTDAQGAHTPTTSSVTNNLTAAFTQVGVDLTTTGIGSGGNTIHGPGALNGASNLTLQGTIITTVTMNAVGAHTHNIIGAPTVGTLATAASGGSEARPESAVVLMCIHY